MEWEYPPIPSSSVTWPLFPVPSTLITPLLTACWWFFPHRIQPHGPTHCAGCPASSGAVTQRNWVRCSASDCHLGSCIITSTRPPPLYINTLMACLPGLPEPLLLTLTLDSPHLGQVHDVKYVQTPCVALDLVCRVEGKLTGWDCWHRTTEPSMVASVSWRRPQCVYQPVLLCFCVPVFL